MCTQNRRRPPCMLASKTSLDRDTFATITATTTTTTSTTMKTLMHSNYYLSRPSQPTTLRMNIQLESYSNMDSSASAESFSLSRKSSLQDLEQKLRVFDRWDRTQWTGAKKQQPFRTRLETILEEEEEENGNGIRVGSGNGTSEEQMQVSQCLLQNDGTSSPRSD